MEPFVLLRKSPLGVYKINFSNEVYIFLSTDTRFTRIRHSEKYINIYEDISEIFINFRFLFNKLINIEGDESKTKQSFSGTLMANFE